MPVPARDTDCGPPAASSVMFTAAARTPGASGVKLTLIVQLAPGATEPAPVGQVLPAAKAKSAACAPVMVMLVRLSGAPPLLVSVTFCAALVVPTRCSPNALLVAESVAVGGVTPVPVSDTDCGLSAASSVMVTVAVRALAAVGVKEIGRASCRERATEPTAVGQVLPAAKAESAACAPVMVMLVRLSGVPSLLVRVTFCATLMVVTSCLLTALLVAESVAVRDVTLVPVSDTDCGLSAASSVMVTVAVRALAAVGVKVRLRTQLAPAASVAPLMQVVPEASAKSPALAPPSTAVAMLRGAVPLLVRVTVCTGLGVLTR